MKMGLKNKLHLTNVGRRTGKNVLVGKIVSQKSNGMENFSDYWTDTESVLSDETTTNNCELTLSSTNVSDQESDSTCCIRSTRKKTTNEKREVLHNYSYKSSKQFLKNSNVVSSKNREMDNIVRSNKIQPSCLLNEKGSSHSRNKTYLKTEDSCLSDSENFSSIQKSSKDLSNASANKIGGLSLSTDNANSKSTPSYKMNPGIKSKSNKDSFMNEVTVLSSNKKSNLKETQGKEIDAPHNMRNSSRRKSQILFNASSLVNNKEKVIKRNSDVMSSQDVVLDHREKIFLKNNRTLNSSERENAIKLNMQNSSTENSFVATKRNMKAMDTLNDKSSKFIDIEKSNDKGNGRSSRGKRSILPAAELKCGNESNSSISKGEISPVEEKTSKIKLSFKETREKIHPIYHTRNASVRQYPQVLSDSSSMEEVEVLPSEEKANKISSFKETRGEKISSVYHRRNSSKRQSPQVLSDTSSVSNYRKSVSRRNAGVASTQDEMPNLMDASYNLRCRPHKFPLINCSADEGNNNSSNSCAKTAKPMHSESQKTTKKDDRHKKEVASCPIRRSTRTRFPPLASWRNERLKFKKVGSEDIVSLGIDKGLPEDDYAYRYLAKKLYGKKNQKPKASYKNRTRHIKKTTISLVNTGEKVKVQVNYPFNTCQFTVPEIESGNVTMCKQITSTLTKFGFINIPAHGMKNVQVPDDSNMHFVVVQGTVDAVIAESSYTFSKWDSFVVPYGNGYSLSNKGPLNALLNYCQSKVPFFNYQVFKCNV